LAVRLEKGLIMSGAGKKAVMLLGHGSKAPEANETLRKVGRALEARGAYGCVQSAFLQMEMPDFQAAADILVSKGFRDILVMPYFLYMGLHVTKDLPAEIEEARKRHPGLQVSVADNLGFHEKLVDITMERINEVCPPEGNKAVPCQHPIERESFRIIGTELDEAALDPAELPIVKRVIHSTADFEYKDMLAFSPGSIEAGVAAMRSGKNIITDVKMIEAGIARARLAPFGAEVLCFSSDRDVAEAAVKGNMTKTAASMRKAAVFMDGAVMAIGNAPTALMELIKIVKEGGPRPALVIGVPVGFVGAVEAKEELQGSGLPYILARGRKGGSTVAVAIVNALAIMAAEAAGAK